MKTSTTKSRITKPSNGSTDEANTSPQVVVEIKPLKIRVLKLTLVGDSPLIVHAWSFKAQRQIVQKHMGEAPDDGTKEAKDPVECMRDCLSQLPGGKGYGFPAIAVKKALVAVANQAGLKKVDMRYAFHVIGDLLPIQAPPLESPYTEWDTRFWSQLAFAAKHGASLRMDPVRIGMNKPDMRFRAQFPVWSIPNIVIHYNASVCTPSLLVNVAQLAGFANGLGEWRSQKDGGFGMFHVEATGLPVTD